MKWVRRLAAIALVAVVPITACEKVGVASSVSPCFRVLPIAHAALGNAGSRSPVDIARVRGGAMPAFGPFRPHPTTTVAGTPPRPRDVCLIAYKGPFTASQVTGRLIGPHTAGQFAIVVVAVRTQRVVSVFLSDRLPSPLHHH